MNYLQFNISSLISDTIIISALINNNKVLQEKIRGQRGRLQVQALEYANSTKVVFWDISRTEVCFPRRLSELNKMADSVEISFVDENNFV